MKHKLDTETVSFKVKVVPYETCWLSAFNLKVNPRHFHFGLHFFLLLLWYLLSTFRQTWKNNRQPKQSLGDFWLLCNFFHRATSRNHCQPFGEYPFLLATSGCIHIQYGKQLLSNVHMTSHEKSQRLLCYNVVFSWLINLLFIH